MLALIPDSVPLARTSYDEIAEAFGTPAGPVSETRAAPFGAKLTENAPGPELGFTTIGDRAPSAWTRNASIEFVSLSVTRRTLPSGLNAKEAEPDVLVDQETGGIRQLRELAVIKLEAHDIAAGPGIEYINEIPLLRHRIRLASTGAYFVNKRQLRSLNAKVSLLMWIELRSAHELAQYA